MLFNSYEFLFAFLPAILGLYWLVAGSHVRGAIFILAAGSLFFYGYWSMATLPILAVSVLVNFCAGRGLSGDRLSAQHRHFVFVAGLVFNLGLICFFKYAGFIVWNLNAVLAWVHFTVLPVPSHDLPIGISFFTFTQIAYLVDAYRNTALKPSFGRYVVFVTYFPHLIAGPILHYRQLIPQLDQTPSGGRKQAQVATGLLVFGFGLAKKVLIADSIAPMADAGFDAVAAGEMISSAGAWTASVAYAMQIYFDFSGYSDMAVGISLFFGIYLPVNFASPYKATSIIEFWRRWHISLSCFLRDYVYIPLGGNRLGKGRRYLNLLTTMFLGGLWHGASWTFVLWGCAHGALLAINHLWRDVRGAVRPGRIARAAGWAGTFFFVVLTWVLFRANTLRDAVQLYRSMFDFGWFALNPAVVTDGTASRLDEGGLIGRIRGFWAEEVVPGYACGDAVPLIGLLLAICLLLPPLIEERPGAVPLGSRYIEEFAKRPFLSVGAGVATAGLIFLSILFMAKLAPFLYFQF